jgi:hypothetical protein
MMKTMDEGVSEVQQVVAEFVPPIAFPRSDRHRLRRHVVNIALIVFAIVALFWRVFFLGETLVDVATLNNQLPWGYNSGESNYPYNRRDLTDMYVTRDYFVVAAYRDGEFPLWNPYTMAGHPIYADGVTRTLSPFLLFYKVFDVPLGYSLARLTELLLASVFMYVFALGIGASPNGALMGSLVFGLSAHSMLHLTGLGWWGGLMWLPLIMLFVDRAISRDSLKQAALAGVFLAAQFFCGYLPNQIYYAGAVLLCYAFFALVRDGGVARRSRIVRASLMTGVTLGIGFALAATQWVPMLELLKYSNRRVIGAELGYIYLPPWYAGTLVFPNLFGSAYDVRTLTLFTGLGVSHDHILYLGVAALAPLGFAVYLFKRRGLDGSVHRRVAFFVLLGAVSLAIMMAAPLYVPVTRFIPVLQVIRVAVRAGVLFLFAASALVALGTDHLLSASAEGISLYENKNALPRAFFVSQVVVESGHEEAIGRLGKPGLNLRTKAVVEGGAQLLAKVEPPPAEIEVGIGRADSSVARIIEDKRNRVIIETDNEKAEALVLSDNYYPGWKAFVDGEPTQIFQANCTMRTVAVPSGHHLVSFIFMPATLKASAYVSFAAAALTLISLVLPFGKRTRNSRRE